MKKPTQIDAIDSTWRWSPAPSTELIEAGGELLLAVDFSKERTPVADESNAFYQPLKEHSALFVEFARTPPTKAKILKFAHKFGLLGIAPEHREFERVANRIEGQLGRTPRLVGDKEHKFIASEVLKLLKRQGELYGRDSALYWRLFKFPCAERLADWQIEIKTMRDAVALWRTSEGEQGPSDREIVARIARKVRVDSRVLSADQIARLCTAGLSTILNDQLQRYPLTARIVPTANGDFQLTFAPTALISAMWLQFAQAVARNYAIKICRGCGRPFQTGAGTNRRADATTCKDACRQAAHRREKNG